MMISSAAAAEAVCTAMHMACAQGQLKLRVHLISIDADSAEHMSIQRCATSASVSGEGAVLN
jgi:hypothetical protein